MVSTGRLMGAAVIVAELLVYSFAPGAKAKDLKNTQITPHVDVPIRSGENVVFCSTFQLAWSEMKTEIIGEDIRLEKPLDLVRFLNRGLSTRADLAGEDYVAMAGYGADDIAGKINRALRKKFGAGAPVVDREYNDDDVIVAYAFLWKEILFPEAFVDFERPMTFYGADGGTPVRVFGVDGYSDRRHRGVRAQVDVIEYSLGHELIVRLGSKNPDDEVVLAMVEPEKTLLETVEKVDQRVTADGRRRETARLADGDVLQIPKLELSADHSYSSLEGLYLLNEGFEGYFVYQAEQDVRFRLDQTGAAVKSEAVFTIKKGPQRFRALIFNQPFLLYLKNKGGKHPYFAMWVENAEFMETRGGG